MAHDRPHDDSPHSNPHPRVSVIIPTYNGDRYLGAAIESVLTQTYSKFEVIAVDDGSTDQTLDILASYSNRIRWLTQPHQGVAIARNRGIQAARGSLIAFLDQDDVFLPDKLESQVRDLDSHPSWDFVTSGWRILDEQGRSRSEVRPWQGLPDLSAQAWIIWKPVFLGAMVFQKASLDAVGGFDAAFQQTSDVDLVLRLVTHGCQSGWTTQATVGYRQHHSNASRNVFHQAQELEDTMTQFFKRPDLPSSIRQLETSSRYQSLVWSAWRFYASGDFENMGTYLKKSVPHTSLLPSEIVLNWVNQFKQYANEYGTPLDTLKLSQLSVWQQITTQLLQHRQP